MKTISNNYTKSDISHAICNKCGAGIKHIYFYNNKTYGSTCIDRMLGINVKSYNSYNVDSILKKIEKSAEDCRIEHQKMIDEDLPIVKKLLNSNHVGIIGNKIELNVQVTKSFWFEGGYGASHCIGMIDAEDNQYITFTTSMKLDEIEEGDSIKISATVKNHNKVSYTKVFNERGLMEEVFEHLGGIKHSGYLSRIEVIKLNNKDPYSINQTQLTRIKLIK